MEGKIETVLQESLLKINEYCESIGSSVKFIGHIDDLRVLNIYPYFGISDPLGIRMNISGMDRGKKEILEILANNGVKAYFENTPDGIGFSGILIESGQAIRKEMGNGNS